MSVCEKCKVDFGEASYKFCLECGSQLVADLSEPTMLIHPTEPLSHALTEAMAKLRKIREEKERVKQSCLEFIHEAAGFGDLEFDSRWERLIERYFDADADSCLRFLKRVIGRIRLAGNDAEMLSGVKYDLARAIQYTDPSEADDYLRQNGLL